MSERNWQICKWKADEHMDKAEAYIDADRTDIAGAHAQCAAMFLVGMRLCEQLDEVVDAINESSAGAKGRWRGGGPG